jgi:hypothetical protein
MTTRRSLRASPEGIEKARRALTQNSLTQLALAEELGGNVLDLLFLKLNSIVRQE